MKTRRTFLTRGLAAAGLLAINRTAFAHGGAKHAGSSPPAAAAAEQQAWGIAGDPAAVARTIPVVMTDAMRFSPDHVEVRLGETIRFAHRNAGKVLHEFVIGTPAALDEHAALMKRFPEMEHDEPWMAHIGPGEEGEIVWRFNRAGEFRFGCLIPGHYEAGMVGTIVVRPA
jgi:uncharacterized cupredoxin-like copper-binding protein